MKNKTLGLLLAGIIFTPFAAVANSDDSAYPAANFQPTVIFADESAKSTAGSQQSAFDADYPAASFQPKVLFADASATSSSGGTSTGEKSSFDPKYPAANFEPKVIYP
jgi:hypothetical protein